MTTLSAPNKAEIIRRALSDTGYFARNILGYNYDKDEETGIVYNEGEGGIRASGPHRKMVEFIDDPSTRYKHLEAPRGSYKSTILVAYAMRRAIKYRNLRVLYCMKTYSEACEKVAHIRDQFDSAANLNKLFGDLSSPKWAAHNFTLTGRVNPQPGPSFKAGGVDKNVTGGHFDLIILDDLVIWDNITTPEQIAKTLAFYKMVQPLLDPGGTLIVCGTRYAHNDLYGWLLENSGNQFADLILDCGMRVAKKEDGNHELVGTPIFSHLSEKVLWEKFKSTGRDVKDFSSQYLNVITSGEFDHFFRSDFQHHPWEENWMQFLTGYVLTDTAVTEKEHACLSVSILVGLDGNDNAFVLDAVVGHLDPVAYVSRTVDMFQSWMGRIDIRGMTLEKTAANEVFLVNFANEFRTRKFRAPKIHRLSRQGNDEAKDRRIQRIQQRFRDKRFYFVETIPRFYHDLGRERVLYDPELYRDPDNPEGPPLPGGELVDQFIFFRQGYKDDIADALADIDAVDKDGRRLCKGLGRLAQERQDRLRNREEGLMRVMPVVINGRTVMTDIIPSNNPHDSKSWASRKVQRLKQRGPQDPSRHYR